jgi:endogenous inhibitor of DNA gyrase (YacG/DUF329 family)
MCVRNEKEGKTTTAPASSRHHQIDLPRRLKICRKIGIGEWISKKNMVAVCGQSVTSASPRIGFMN